MSDPWKLARDLRAGDRVRLAGSIERAVVVSAEPNRQRETDHHGRVARYREAVMVVFKIETGPLAGRSFADFPGPDAKVRTS